MLDTRADFRFRIVGTPHRLGHSAAFRLLAMDVADEAILGQERLVDRRSVGGNARLNTLGGIRCWADRTSGNHSNTKALVGMLLIPTATWPHCWRRPRCGFLSFWA